MMQKMLPIAIATLLLSGCVAHATPVPPADKTADQERRGTSCVAAGTWFDPAAQKTLSADHVIERLRDKDVVLLGETHVIADHHRWQLQTIAQLYAQRPDMILGFEAFPRRVQSALDRWVAGELSEKQFLKESDWETVWKFDAAQYMPLFHFARLNRVPMVALNVDRSLIREISAKGWKNVPQEHKRGVGDPVPATPGYLAMLSSVYGRHDNDNGKENGAPKGPGLEDPMFSNFVDVQLTWDRAMAEAADTALKDAQAEGRDPRMVAIIGRGHMDHFYGVPEQLKALGRQDVAVLTPWDQLRKCDELRAPDGTPAADVVFGIEHTADMMEPEKPKLGVLIEGTDQGVRIDKVVSGSIGEAAGLQKDDLIVSAAGVKVSKSGDLVAIIKSMNPGTWLPMNIRRGQDSLEIIARFPRITPAPRHGDQ
ncbi:ChaN family lipoprotein [Magnetovibrio sp.]|uniref:ChaN family lipoprotein n=1 Tax=Magnetovibrio sp. TaxID=2024836 RepID=UPI002F92508B